MATGVDQPRGRRRRSTDGQRPAVAVEPASAVWFTRLTDISLAVTVVAVALCFAGRTPSGQLLFVIGSVSSALCWTLRQQFALTSEWRASRTAWVWGAGILLAVTQTLPMSPAWLKLLSPEHARLLTLWDSETGLLPYWNTLSFYPAETTSGLVTFLCYGLVFFVAVQRIRNQQDVELVLMGIASLAIAVALFALLQYGCSNGLFFWVYQHPTVTTAEVTLGPFTNRNHFAQFLACAIGPTVWWLTKAAAPAEATIGFSQTSSSHRALSCALLTCGLTVIFLAGLLTLSRAGIAAMLVALLTTLWLLSRHRHLPAGILPAMLGMAVLVGGGMAATNYQSLTERFDNYVPDERLVIWAANARLAARFPWLGTGVGTHLLTHPLETDRIDNGKEFTHAESGYLQVASECGLVSIGLTVLMIGICLNWCRRAGHTAAGPASTAAAAGIGAGIVANLLHAWVDFFWFAPGCMLLMTLLAACACRLSQLADVRQGVAEPLRPRSRLSWGIATCGVAVLAAWMITVKLPAALAEPHRVAYLNLRYHGGEDHTDDDEDAREMERLKLTELLAAARANPRDCRAQLQAASASLRAFSLRQQAGDNPMSLDLLRDAAVASEFASSAELHAWLETVTGPHLKYLKAARHYARRAVMACPLEGMAYLYLAQLEFLRDPAAERESTWQQQAAAVRPYDAAIDFEIGKTAFLQGENDRALSFWKQAFHRSPEYRREIAASLCEQVPAEELLEHLDPDWLGLGALLSAYQSANLTDELSLLRERYAAASVVRATQQTGSASDYAWQEAVRVYRDDEQFELAIQTAQRALEHSSQSVELHQLLGELLLTVEDFAGAAKHLQWVAVRSPTDDAAQRQAAEATKLKLRHERTATKSPAADPPAWR